MFMYFLLRFIFELTLNARKFDFWFKKKQGKSGAPYIFVGFYVIWLLNDIILSVSIMPSMFWDGTEAANAIRSCISFWQTRSRFADKI